MYRTFFSILTVTGLLLLSSCSTTQEHLTPKNSRHFEFTYTVDVDLRDDTAKPLDIWIPIAQSDINQQIEAVNIITDLPYEPILDSEYGNKLLHVYDSTGSLKTALVQVDYSIIRHQAGRDTISPPKTRFLKADKLVPIDGKIASEADSILPPNISPEQTAKVLYDHLFETMQYDKSGEGWGNGDANFACDSRRGNCTDIHSLFIGMARSHGLQSRFSIGFPIPNDSDSGTVHGYHCWAEYYSADSGWLPVDISEAIKNPERKSELFGHLDADRVTFTIGRDIPLPNNDTLNYLIYPYVLVGGMPYSNFTKSFSFKNK